MALYWLIFLLILAFALYDIKRTIIAWMPLQLLFNDAVAIKYTSPVLSLIIVVNFILPLIFYFKIFTNHKIKKGLDNSPFFYKPLFFAYVISYLLSLIFSIVPLTATAFNTMLKFFCTNFVMVAVFQKCIVDTKDIRFFLKSCVVLLVLLTADGVYESITSHNPVLDYIYINCPDASIIKDRMYYIPASFGGEHEMRYGLVRAYSFFGIHIAYGTTCILLFYLFFSLYNKKSNIIPKKIILYSGLMALLGIFLCNSKTPLVGLIFFILAIFKLKNIINIKTILLLVLTLSFILFLFPSVINNILSLFDPNLAEEGGGSTVAGREEQFEVVKRLFYMNPLFGNGIGSINAMKTIGNNADILGAESSWFQILPERGILGCAIYIYWYIFTYKKISNIFPSKEALFFLIGLLAMETATGYLNIAFYSSIIILLYKFYKIKKT